MKCWNHRWKRWTTPNEQNTLDANILVTRLAPRIIMREHVSLKYHLSRWKFSAGIEMCALRIGENRLSCVDPMFGRLCVCLFMYVNQNSHPNEVAWLAEFWWNASLTWCHSHEKSLRTSNRPVPSVRIASHFFFCIESMFCSKVARFIDFLFIFIFRFFVVVAFLLWFVVYCVDFVCICPWFVSRLLK